MTSKPEAHVHDRLRVKCHMCVDREAYISKLEAVAKDSKRLSKLQRDGLYSTGLAWENLHTSLAALNVPSGKPKSGGASQGSGGEG